MRKTTIICIEAVGLLALAATLFVAARYFPHLPDRIPHRFDFNGMPTVYGGRKMIWSLPVLGALMYLVLTTLGGGIKFLGKKDEKTLAVLSLVQDMLRMIKLCFILLCLYLVLGSIGIATGRISKLDGISGYLFPVILITIVIVYVILIIRKQSVNDSATGGPAGKA